MVFYKYNKWLKHKIMGKRDKRTTTSLEEEVHGTKRTRTSSIAAIFVTILVLAAITALTLWLVYKPHNPKFMVLGASAILTNNDTSTETTTWTIRFVMISRNPNKRVAIRYDRLSAFVAIKITNYQMMTAAIQQPVVVDMPPFFHRKNSAVEIAIPPMRLDVMRGGFGMDESAMGVIGVRLVLFGRLRWKAGAITTSHYHVYVSCDVLLRATSKGFVDQIPLLVDGSYCNVDV